MSFVWDSQFRNRQASILVDGRDLKNCVVGYLQYEMLWFSIIGKTLPISVEKSEITFDAKEFLLSFSPKSKIWKQSYGNMDILRTMNF